MWWLHNVVATLAVVWSILHPTVYTQARRLSALAFNGHDSTNTNSGLIGITGGEGGPQSWGEISPRNPVLQLENLSLLTMLHYNNVGPNNIFWNFLVYSQLQQLLESIYGRFHVKGPRKKVNVKKGIFFDEM